MPIFTQFIQRNYTQGIAFLHINRYRLLVSMSIGIVSACLCWIRLAALDMEAADFTWAWRGAQFLWAGDNPYSAIQPTGAYPYNDKLYYPLPALLIALPTAILPGPLAGAVFIGIASGLLGWGVLRQGAHYLCLFISAPYVYSVITVQWAPLIAAAALISGLAPVLLAKPNLGAPIFIAFGTRIHAALCVGTIIISIVVLPTWVSDWLTALSKHANYTPLLTWFGPALLLAAFRWRTRTARLFLAMVVIPQRLVYDQVNLWLTPSTLRQSLILTSASWLGVIVGFQTQQGVWALFFIYIAALGIVLNQRPTLNSTPNTHIDTLEAA